MLTKYDLIYDLNVKKIGKLLSCITFPNPKNPIRLPLGHS